MAKMYPDNIELFYDATASEKKVYYALKTQLPDKDFEVFYSVKWQRKRKDKVEKSEADFVVTSPKYGILCLEVKGGTNISIDAESGWHLDDSEGGRDLNESPYDQAEKSMYYFKDIYEGINHIKYPGIYAAGAAFPFYNLSEELVAQISNRNSECTIMFKDMSFIGDKIKKMFKAWGGESFGNRLYSKQSHEAMLEVIRKRIAISAAAGALVEVKERELITINRVQDNYVYFLSNIRQFYIRGGAGTGKTWIAMKMAKNEAAAGKKTMFLCASEPLKKFVRTILESNVDVYDVKMLFSLIAPGYETLSAPTYEGVSDLLIEDISKYDAIFIDEAQDFTEEWAYIVKTLLADEKHSRLGVFYDDVQIVRSDSFGDAFMIDTPPFLLNENIRNTSNIYNWATDNTNLGKDVITNPVEGPVPHREMIMDRRHLTKRLENLFKEYIIDEALSYKSIVLLVQDKEAFFNEYPDGIAMWKFTEDVYEEDGKIHVSTPEDFKGLEADMVIYIHDYRSSDNINYIAYTRAKYYLIELILK